MAVQIKESPRGLNLKVIFGMKLKQFREHAGLSLTGFAARTGLSVSYLTEIEHGKKYPKAEKIARMADALEKNYDDLVSLKLDEELSPLAGFLASPVLHNFPYHLFGISPTQVVELMTRQPAEASALVNALIGIAEQYNIGVEHLFRSALRSYQELHENYFPEIEHAVDQFVQSHGIESGTTVKLSSLRELVEREFSYQLDESRLSAHPALRHFRSVLAPRGRQSSLLLINPGLSDWQKKFILAREIGYRVLGLEARAMTSAPERVDSFEQVLNDFKASYFAGALLVNRERAVADMKGFFGAKKFQPEKFRSFLDRYEVTPEIFLYRLTELLPQYFGFKLHFLRFNHEGDSFRLVKHLNMSQILIPSGTSLDEHYCRRWLAIKIIQDLERMHRSRKKPVEPIVLGQVSQFIDSDSRFLCIALARHLAISPGVTSSVSLGFRFDQNVENTIRFAKDPELARTEINGTCERCRLVNCDERVAPPRIIERQNARLEIERELASLNSLSNPPS